MELAVAEAQRAGDRGDYPIGAVITRLMGKREVVIASAGIRGFVKSPRQTGVFKLGLRALLSDYPFSIRRSLMRSLST
jgi:hypothetical protein